MVSCIHTESVSVFVNGIPTQEFWTEKGLRQGGPLAPFLFLVATEGLDGLMRNAMDMGFYKPFKVNEDVSYYML